MVPVRLAVVALGVGGVAATGAFLAFRRWRRRQQKTIPGVLADSGLWIAALRAIDSTDPQPLRTVDNTNPLPLIDDALAVVLSASVLPEMLEKRERWLQLTNNQQQLAQGQSLSSVFTLRARFGHDFVGKAISKLANEGQQGVRVVCLGCGFDTRPWTLGDFKAVSSAARFDVDWIDVDVGEVLARKNTLLRQAGAQVAAAEEKADEISGTKFPLLTSSYQALAVDLTDPQQLETVLGKCGSTPTIWIAEGLLMFQPPAALHALLRVMAMLSCPGSGLVCDIPNEAAVAYCQQMVRENAAPSSYLCAELKWGCNDPSKVLREHGWAALTVATMQDVAKSYDRGMLCDDEIVGPVLLSSDSCKWWFVTAELAA